MMTPILVPTLDELGVEFERAAALYRATSTACQAEPESKALDPAAENSSAELTDICAAIAGLPAQTRQHLRIKAVVLNIAFPDEPVLVDERLAFQLARAFLDGLPEYLP